MAGATGFKRFDIEDGDNILNELSFNQMLSIDTEEATLTEIDLDYFEDDDNGDAEAKAIDAIADLIAEYEAKAAENSRANSHANIPQYRSSCHWAAAVPAIPAAPLLPKAPTCFYEITVTTAAAAPTRASSKSVLDKAKIGKPWTEEETKCLREGMALYALRKQRWALIKKQFPVQLQQRSNIDLKDRWRNLQGRKQIRKRKTKLSTASASVSSPSKRPRCSC